MGAAMADDLPRTLRREREARERAGQPLPVTSPQTATPATAPHMALGAHGAHGGSVPDPALPEGVAMSGTTVTDIRVPFLRLMMFCFKLVFAAIPALILLGALLWLAGHLLMLYAPWLVKLQILIRVPT